MTLPDWNDWPAWKAWADRLRHDPAAVRKATLEAVPLPGDRPVAAEGIRGAVLRASGGRVDLAAGEPGWLVKRLAGAERVYLEDAWVVYETLMGG